MAVEFFDAAEHPLATRRYHYEDQSYRHLLTGITDENGVRFATYAYNGSGQAVLSEHAGGVNRYTFSYPEQAKRVITDPIGTQREVAVTYSHGGVGLVSSASQPGGAGCGPGSSKRTYDRNGRPSSSTDFNEKKTCFINDPARGFVISGVSGLGATALCPASGTETIAAGTRRLSRQWHPDVELETALAGPKQITRYVYNGQPDANGVTASCAANATLPNGKPVVVLCYKTVQATRDANGAAGFAAQPDGGLRTWRYSYNAAGQLLKATGPTDAFGQTESVTNIYFDDTTASHTKRDLASTQNATGEVTKFLEYTKDGLPSKIQRSNGVVKTMTFGAKQRLESSMIAGSGGSETTRYAYDRIGQLTSLVTPDGSKVKFTYDDAQRLKGLSDGAGNQIQLTLDNLGNVTRQEQRNALGALVQVSNRAFDALNRLVSVQRGKLAPTTYQYDRAGNHTASKDALGRITTAEFDSLDRMTKTTLPAATLGKTATTIDYGYDHQDSLVSVTDTRNLTTRYTIDGHGQLAGLISPDTATSLFQFDDAGNMISDRDGRGVTTGHRYDASRRVTKSGASTFEYGKDGLSAAGRLTKMTDESGKSVFTYDAYGRLQGQLQTVGTGAGTKQFSLGYKYGTSGAGTGHITSMTYPSGNRIDIMYGDNRQAINFVLFAPMATTPTTILSNIRYTALGAVEGWNWGNPVNTNVYNRQFDGNGRLKNYPLGVPGATGTLRTLNYDAADRIKSILHSGAPNAARLDQSYTYDDLDRLIRVEGGSVSQAFDYDSNGNRIQVRFGSSTYTNTIQSLSNRLMSTTGPIPAKTNTYDNAGNLTSDGSAKYSYGTNGRLSAVVAAGATTRYRYNGFGERVEKVGPAGNVTYYVYDQAGRLLGEYDPTGKAIQETVYLGSLPVAVLKPSGGSAPTTLTEVYSVYADHILTPRVITRLNDSRIVWRWDNTDPFGLQPPDESPGGLPKFTYNPRFPGQVFDKETNNHYNYFRDYDPQTGQYIQPDPVGLSGGINTYGYVGANPLNFFDPYGLTQCDIDFALQFAVINNLDLNFGEGAPIVNLPWNGKVAGHAELRQQGLSYAPDRTGRIHLRMSYLDPLSTALKVQLLETIIHEALHFSGPSLLQDKDFGSDHDFIDQDTKRRLTALKQRYLKALKNCGC
jgi:RHS repeat-associated protein